MFVRNSFMHILNFNLSIKGFLHFFSYTIFHIQTCLQIPGTYFRKYRWTLTNNLTLVYILVTILNCVSAAKPTPKPNLTQMVKTGDWKLTQDFLEKNPSSVDSINENGGRAIHEAVRLGDAKQTKTLIQFKANVNVKNNVGMTPLHIASLHGYTDCVKVLLDAGALPNEKDIKNKLPIHYAVSNTTGNINVLKLLLKQGSLIDPKDHKKETPLIYSIRKKNFQFAKYLLANQASIHVVDEDGFSLLHILALNGNLELLKIIVELGVNPNTLIEKGNLTPLHFAAMNGHLESLHYLLSKGANPDIQDDTGYTALHYAVKEGDLETVTALLRKKANPNLRAIDGFPPLFIAAQEGYGNIAKKLLENQAEPNLQGYDKRAAIHKASFEGHLEVVKVLLEYKANTEIRDKFGWTPLISASSGGQLKVVQLLLEQKVNLNAVSDHKTTSLYSAAAEGHTDVVEALLDAGAAIDLPDTVSPIDVANAYGHHQIAELIRKRGK